MLEFETRGRYSNDESSLGIRIGKYFYGTEGYLELDGENCGKLSGKGKKNLLQDQKQVEREQKILLSWQHPAVQIIGLIFLMLYDQVKTKLLLATLMRAFYLPHFHTWQTYPIAWDVALNLTEVPKSL